MVCYSKFTPCTVFFRNFKVSDIEIPPITLHLSTYGGEVYSGFGLYEVIKNSTTPIEIICEGKVMSCGVIAMLGSKVRKAYKTTTFMIYDISRWMFGKLKECEERIEEMKLLNDLEWEIYEQETKFPHKLYDEIMNCKKDYYISTERALELGLITELI